MGLLDNQTQEQYYLGNDGTQLSNDESYGAYQFITLKDIVNSFIVAYVGEDKIISKNFDFESLVSWPIAPIFFVPRTNKIIIAQAEIEVAIGAAIHP